MKKILAAALALALAASLTACGGHANPGNGKSTTGAAAGSAPAKVGVSLPDKSVQRWASDGSIIKAGLEKDGYTVDLQYAGKSDPGLQASQIENMVSEGCKLLIVMSVDDGSLNAALGQAGKKGIQVIAYDHLIMNSDAVSYFCTFDNTQAGELMGSYIRDKLNLDYEAGPFNIEMFMGSPNDNNNNFYFGGAMDILQPYIDSGKLVILSGEQELPQCTTENESAKIAQDRMEALISMEKYGPGKGDTKLDAILSSSDSVSRGITAALVGKGGYTKNDFPILTGQGCELDSVRNMIGGLQSMSVLKDTRKLAQRAVLMAESALKGQEPEINDDTTYDNGTGLIPSYLEAPAVCTADNYKAMLVDTGYYAEGQLK